MDAILEGVKDLAVKAHAWQIRVPLCKVDQATLSNVHRVTILVLLAHTS
jgi:hypothetical protein